MITITNERLMVQIDPLGAQMHSIKRRGEDRGGEKTLGIGGQGAWKKPGAVGIN